MQLINAVSLHKEYTQGNSKTHAVRGVSLDINQGESIAVTGPSGCGKTTLLNIIGLIVSPTRGELHVQGKEATTFTDKRRAEYRNKFYGYVVQDFALVEDYTARENVEIPLLYSHERLGFIERKKRAVDALAKVGLADKIKEKAKNLSGGQRQRVAIARALVNNPQVILADEPTGSLDSETGIEILKLLFDLVEEGKTLLLATHNLDLAGQCKKHFKMLDGAWDPDVQT
ncbi:MAG: ABC transporter ATP-binding protein [Firmicutes bacterium]|nr:ABC transporter ATP-binding protein [Bacillota bacterium]